MSSSEIQSSDGAVETDAATARETDVVGPDALDTDVPPGDSPFECEYCGRPFRHEDHLVLHRGLDHPDALSESEVEAFQETYRAEAEEIRLFRLKALALLVLLYFGFLFAYSAIP